MADSVNRIAPTTVPLGHTDPLKRERQEKNHGARRRDKRPQPPSHGEDPAGDIGEPSDTEQSKGKHLNIKA
jgi:hypothetical protein